MKWVLILSVITVTSAFGKTTTDFSKALNDDLRRDIRKDDEKFRKESFRRPASVEAAEAPVIEETSKIDKNIRQIGPNKW